MSTLDEIAEFLQACPADGEFAVPDPQDPSHAVRITVADLAGLVNYAREYETYREDAQENLAYGEGVVNDLGNYIDNMRALGQPVDPQLESILSQEDEDGEEYDPNQVAAALTALQVLGVQATAETAVQLLAMISQAAPGQPQAAPVPLSPIQPSRPPTFGVQQTPAPAAFNGAAPRPRRVLVPGSSQAQGVVRAVAQQQSFHHPTPSPRRESAPPVSAEVLFGLQRSGSGKLDGGSLGSL